MFDKDNKFGFIVNNNESNNIKNTDLPCTVSSKVLATVPASNIKLDDDITVNNISLNKDKKYYIEFLGSKKLCNVMVDESHGELACTVDNYTILGICFSSNLMLGVHKMSPDDTTDTFTDLVIYEEEIKCLDNKYLENDLRVQNSISLGRTGDIGTKSSAIGLDVIAIGMASHAEGYGTHASGNFSHAEGNGTIASGNTSHAEGMDTIASSMYQHVQGKNNIEDNLGKYAHIVGNGEDLNNRSNAHTLDWKGNAWYSGKLSQEGAPTEDKDLTTKKYVDDKVAVKLLPVEYDNGKIVNVKNLEAHSTYICPNDVDLLDLEYEKDSKLIAFLITPNKEQLIYVGNKTDKQIELMVGVNSYVIHFKTETQAGSMERNVYYLTPNNNTAFTPTKDYNPVHKKYVDDKVSSLPQFSFNENGELVVKIGDTTKIFVPKE